MSHSTPALLPPLPSLLPSSLLQPPPLPPPPAAPPATALAAASRACQAAHMASPAAARPLCPAAVPSAATHAAAIAATVAPGASVAPITAPTSSSVASITKRRRGRRPVPAALSSAISLSSAVAAARAAASQALAGLPPRPSQLQPVHPAGGLKYARLELFALSHAAPPPSPAVASACAAADRWTARPAPPRLLGGQEVQPSPTPIIPHAVADAAAPAAAVAVAAAAAAAWPYAAATGFSCTVGELQAYTAHYELCAVPDNGDCVWAALLHGLKSVHRAAPTATVAGLKDHLLGPALSLLSADHSVMALLQPLAATGVGRLGPRGDLVKVETTVPAYLAHLRRPGAWAPPELAAPLAAAACAVAVQEIRWDAGAPANVGAAACLWLPPPLLPAAGAARHIPLVLLRTTATHTSGWARPDIPGCYSNHVPASAPAQLDPVDADYTGLVHAMAAATTTFATVAAVPAAVIAATAPAAPAAAAAAVSRAVAPVAAAAAAAAAQAAV